MITAKQFENYELHDDATEFGGISFVGQTLADFMEEVDRPLSTPMRKVNQILKECGIEPIKY